MDRSGGGRIEVAREARAGRAQEMVLTGREVAAEPATMMRAFLERKR